MRQISWDLVGPRTSGLFLPLGYEREREMQVGLRIRIIYHLKIMVILSGPI